MKHLQTVYECLKASSSHSSKQVYNYTIPQSWNTFGYSKGTTLRSGELMIDPYDYSCFALANMMEIIKQNKEPLPLLSKEKGKKGAWLSKQVLYVMDLRTMGAWDHDRSDRLELGNLYGFNDQGTFLKAMLLLPLLKRAGITTLVMPNVLAMGNPHESHDFADFHAVTSWDTMDVSYGDPLLHKCSIEIQFHAFVEAAHGLGMRLMLGVSPALLARDNAYIVKHPDWFYWIEKQKEYSYCAPHVDGLPSNCAPSEKVCRLLYGQESGKAHIEAFVAAPSLEKQTTLTEIEESLHITTAPMITDQINANLPPQRDVTKLRFYEDNSPWNKETTIPCLMQDQVRMDLYPGKHANKALWDTMIQAYESWVSEYGIDGFYLMDLYMLPKAFIKELITRLRKQQSHLAFLGESVDMHEAGKWAKLGFDAITGASGYESYDVNNHRYHNFTYALKQFDLPVCAASEFLDTPRIVQYDGGTTLASLLHFMNLFLPNAIPTIMGGQLALEKQPQYLSCFADQNFLEQLPRKDQKFRRQAMLDRVTYDYTKKDFHVFINHLERFQTYRKAYLPAIMNPERCIPVWFDDPRDPGIGFTFIGDTKALLVVCNTNLYEEVDLRIHTENMLWELPFQWHSIQQSYSSHDPYVHELQFDEFQTLPMHFGIGEVKIIEIIGEAQVC